MTTITAIEASNVLADLAARIRQEHEAAAVAVRHGVEHAINAGDLLIEAKAQLKHGQWLPWLSKHCQIPERTAQLYMRLARHASEIRNVADLTVRKAIEALAPPQTEEEALAAATLAEGEAILERIAVAEANLMDEVRAKMERQRAFAIDFFELSPSEQWELLDQLAESGIHKLLPRWRKINDEDIREAQWRISCLIAV
jgi:hypothetical protein